MQEGRVVWFNSVRGYGFVKGSDGTEYFVHHTCINMDGYRKLEPNQRVTFTPEMGPRGMQAGDVSVVR
jgi:CspA family cold shock protein